MNRRGQALILFILLMPVFLIFMTGIMELGSLLVDKKELANTSKTCLEHSRNNLTNCLIDNGVSEYHFDGYRLVTKRNHHGFIADFNYKLESTYIINGSRVLKE